MRVLRIKFHERQNDSYISVLVIARIRLEIGYALLSFSVSLSFLS